MDFLELALGFYNWIKIKILYLSVAKLLLLEISRLAEAN